MLIFNVESHPASGLYTALAQRDNVLAPGQELFMHLNERL